MFIGKSDIFRNIFASPKGVAIYGLVLGAFLLAACSESGERDNPTDPYAYNYVAPVETKVHYDTVMTVQANDTVWTVVDKTALNADTTIKKSWKSMNPAIAYGEYVDVRDSQVYRTVTIGSQVWLAENVNYAKSGKCFDGDTALCAKYGRLYTWKEASSACPKKFHLPTRSEWDELPGGAEALMSRRSWSLDDGGTGGSDAYGFSALPGGYYTAGDTTKKVVKGYYGLAESAYFWTATAISADSAYSQIFSSTGNIWPGYSLKKDAYSVRCVYDAGTAQ